MNRIAGPVGIPPFTGVERDPAAAANVVFANRLDRLSRAPLQREFPCHVAPPDLSKSAASDATAIARHGARRVIGASTQPRAAASGGVHAARFSARLGGDARAARRTPRRPRAAALPDRPQLRVDVRQMALDRADAEEQALGDRLVRQPRGHELEHLQLARAEVVDGRTGTRSPRTCRGTRRARETNCSHAGSSASRMWFAESSSDQARTRDERGEQPALLDGHDTIAARVDHQRPGAYRAARSRRRRWRRAPRTAAPPHRPRSVVRSRSSYQAICSGVPWGRKSMLNTWRNAGSSARPPGADRRDQRLFLLALPAQPPAARVAAVEDEIGDPLGVPRGVRHRDRRALRDAEQREALQPAASTTASRSPTQVSTDSSPTSASESPQPRSSYRRTVWRSPSRSSQWRHTGLSQSSSRWVSQVATLTSGGPRPCIA